MGEFFSQILAEIQSGAFDQKFQVERLAGYPLLAIAQAISMDDSPITQAAMRLKLIMAQI